MIPVEFDQMTVVLGKPQGWRDEDCLPLPVYRDGVRCISCWKLSKEDLEQIEKTGEIWLTILAGESQPPVCLQTENPFIPENNG